LILCPATRQKYLRKTRLCSRQDAKTGISVFRVRPLRLCGRYSDFSVAALLRKVIRRW
jgi:hypothetical protein